jgi:hypothetical protein
MRSDFAAQTSASSSTSCGSSEGCQAGKPPWGRQKPRCAPACGVPTTSDQLKLAKAGGDALVGWFPAQQLGDFAVAPEERRDLRGAAVAASEEVSACTGGEHQPGRSQSFE